jgi:hypothetical protein
MSGGVAALGCGSGKGHAERLECRVGGDGANAAFGQEQYFIVAVDSVE